MHSSSIFKDKPGFQLSLSLYKMLYKNCLQGALRSKEEDKGKIGVL